MSENGLQKVMEHEITESHRMIGVGRDLWGSSSLTLLPKQVHLEQTALDGEVCFIAPDLVLTTQRRP